MAIVDLDFNKWIGEFRAYNPELFTGKHGLSERMATDIAQIAFQAGKTAARKTQPAQADTTPGWPFVESPGEFTERLRIAMHNFPLIGAVRNVLIENPPTLTTPATHGVGDGMVVPEDVCEAMMLLDIGLGFALCHRDFGDTRNAVKDLQKLSKTVYDWTKSQAASAPGGGE